MRNFSHLVRFLPCRVLLLLKANILTPLPVSYSLFLLVLHPYAMSEAPSRTRGAYRGLCTRYFNEAKSVMEAPNTTTEQKVRLNQIIALMEQRLSEIQALDSQILATLKLEAIGDYRFCPSK